MLADAPRSRLGRRDVASSTIRERWPAPAASGRPAAPGCRCGRPPRSRPGELAPTRLLGTGVPRRGSWRRIQPKPPKRKLGFATGERTAAKIQSLAAMSSQRMITGLPPGSPAGGRCPGSGCVLGGAARDHVQAPGDQRRHIANQQVLHRQTARSTCSPSSTSSWRAHGGWFQRHVQHVFEHSAFVQTLNLPGP